MSDLINFIIKYWVEFLFGIVTSCLIAGFRSIWKKIKASDQENQATRDGIKAILHHLIIEDCKKHLSDNYCTIEDLEELEYLVKPYTTLHGNGTAESSFEKVKRLPNFPPEGGKNG